MNKVGIYIHIPFCLKKCDYCDFYSLPNSVNKQDIYVNALLNELSFYEKKLKNYSVSSIYFGGGTPSLLSIKNIKMILNKIKRLNVMDNIEITLEANPETLTYKYLLELLSCGINRLSIGMQSMDNSILNNIGRVHTKEKFIAQFENARKVGFKNISIDVMFGFYKQSIKDLMDTLEEVVSLSPEHISCYSLIIEEGTKIYEDLEKKLIQEADEDLVVLMYNKMSDFLKQYDYNRYEISNFSKKGFESKHNTSYWKNNEYIGIGASASSYIDSTRYKNIMNIDEYIKSNGVCEKIEFEKLSKNDLISEYFFLGLRMDDGVSIRQFEERFEMSIYSLFEKEIKKLLSQELIMIENDTLRLTEKGISVSNYVFNYFII